MQKEPAVIIGAIEAVVIAGLGLVGVLLEWDAELTAASVAAAAAVVAFVGALITRARVFSPATHEAEVADALNTPVPE